jgi:serine/threonine-protein kinase
MADDRSEAHKDVAKPGSAARTLRPDATAGLSTEEIPSDAGLPAGRARISRRQKAAWLILGLASGSLLAGAATWILSRPRPGPPAPALHFVIDLPANAALDRRASPLALSPDGRRLVYVAQIGGTTQLFIRSLDELEFKPVPGTEGAYGPFFSPDSDWIGYFDSRDSRLKKIRAAGGEATALSDAPFGLGAAWSADGTIFFTPDVFSGVNRVSASGSQPSKLTQLEGREYTHRWPEVLPGGKTILFTVGRAGAPNSTCVDALSLRTGERRTLVENAAGARYLPGGHLLFLRAGKIFVQPFDAARLQMVGSAAPLLEDARVDSSLWIAQLSFSCTGSLVYAPRSAEINLRSLIWADRHGAVQRLTVNQGVFSYPRLSPDGKRLALAVQSQDESSHIWVVEVESGSFTQVTTAGKSTMPLWTPDGRWITFASDEDGRWSIYMIPADRSGPPVLLTKGEHPRMPTSWSPDGKNLCFTEFDPDAGADIWILSVRENRTWPFLKRATGEWGGVFSPNGEWLAYTSDESGPNQVYVRPFPGPGEPLQLSTAEGEEPVWSAAGRELFYRYWRRLMSVPLRREPEFTADAPQVLFEGQYEQGEIPIFLNYDVAPDGLRFVLIRSEEDSSSRVHFMHDWFESIQGAFLKKQAGGFRR